MTVDRAHLAKLEVMIGRQLFVRAARGVTLTPVGEQYLKDISGLLQSLEVATERAASDVSLDRTCMALTKAALAGDAAKATQQSNRLEPLWSLFREYGSLRVIASAAKILGQAQRESLPRPLKGLDPAGLDRLLKLLDVLRLQ